MQIWIRRLVIVAVLLGAVGGAYALTQKNGKKKDEVTYEFGSAATGDVRSFVTATGVIQPWKIVDIKSNVGGRIDRLTVDLGDRVKQGQLIMAIDPTDTRAAFEQAQADLHASQAKEDQAVVSVDYQSKQASARIAAAEKAVSSAEAKRAQAEATRDVQPKLTKANVAEAQAALLSAQKSALQSRKTKQQLEEQLSTLREVTIPNSITSVVNNMQQARASMDTASSDYDRQRKLLAQGYVAKSDVETAYSRMATAKASFEMAQKRRQTLERENQLVIRELEARLQGAQDSIDEAEARVTQAQASLDVAESNRYQIGLRAKDYEAAVAGVEQAKADLAAARSERRQIEMKRKDVESAKAQIVRSNASLEQARINAGYTQITAPRNGIVITKNVEQGTVIASSRGSIGSTNALLQIGDTSRLWVVCNVDETDIGQVSKDQKVTVKVDAYPSLLIDGKVIRIDPQAKIDQNVTLIPVTVQLNMPDERFKPGMNATCEFIVDEALNVLTVPNEAIKERGEGGGFYVQQLEAGKPKDVEVEVGLAGPDTTEIRSGLKEGEQVITKIVQPEKAETNNPFNPFGGFGGRGGRGGGGGAGGRGGGGAGGGRGGGR